MPTLYVAVGIPGSGKTTYLKPWAETLGVVYISPDNIRYELNGDSQSQANMQQVWDLAYERIENALSSGKDVVLDSTQYRKRDRENLIRRFRSHATKIISLFFDVPYEICMERNNKRIERVVPVHAMNRMAYYIDTDPPSLSDGFDEIRVIK